MILELVGLTPAHAHHDRSRYDSQVTTIDGDDSQFSDDGATTVAESTNQL